MLSQEIDITTTARDMTPDSPEGREMDARLSTLRMALGTIERSIMNLEVLLEDCWMREEDARQVETLPEEPEEDSTNTEMADDEGRGDPEPSDLRDEADAEVAAPPYEDVDPIPPAPGGDVVSPEEDALLMQPTSQPKVQSLDLIALGARPERSQGKWQG